MAAKMEFKEWANEAMVLVGKSDRGWQKLAAQALGISEMTIVKAKDRKEAGPKMTRALREAQARAQDWTQLRGEAGRWSVALPENRSREDKVWCEVIVTHLRAPRFIAFFQLKTDETVVRRVDQIDNADADELSRLVQAAEAKAYERSRGELASIEAKYAREELIEATADATGMRKAQLKDMTSMDLVALKERFDEETYEDVNKLFMETMHALQDFNGTDAEREAFMRGMEVGQLRLAGEAAMLMKQFGGESAEMAVKITGAYHARRLKRMGLIRKKAK